MPLLIVILILLILTAPWSWAWATIAGVIWFTVKGIVIVALAIAVLRVFS